MKYAGDYYSGMTQFNRARSNMNRLCMDLEHWSREITYKRNAVPFDYTIMIDESIEVPEDIYNKIDAIYGYYCKEMKELSEDQANIRKYGAPGVSRSNTKNFLINWEFYYAKYRDLCRAICPDKKMLANIAVKLCYEKYPSRNKKFIWIVAGSGVIDNIKQIDFELPYKDDAGEYRYLGKRYSFMNVVEKEMIDC